MRSSLPLRSLLVATLALSAPLAALAQKPVYPKPPRVDHHVPATPQNLAWGWLGSDVEPIYRVKSGDIVKIDTINMGRMRDENYLEFLKEYNIPPR